MGASIAKHLAHEGEKVVVNYDSSKEAADSVVKEITDNAGTAIAVSYLTIQEAIKLFGEKGGQYHQYQFRCRHNASSL